MEKAAEKLYIFMKLVKNQFESKIKFWGQITEQKLRTVTQKDYWRILEFFIQSPTRILPNKWSSREGNAYNRRAVRAAIHNRNLDKKLWAKTANHTVFSINQTGTNFVPDKSPADL